MTEQRRRTRGTGTVRLKGSTWHAVWWVVNPGTGKRSQRSRGGFNTEAAAERFLRGVLVRQDQGTHVDVDRRVTVGALLDAWLVSKGVEGRRATTVDGYRNVVDAWIRPRLGAQKAALLTVGQVDEVLADLLARGGRGGRPLSPRSAQLAGTVLRMALAWGVKRGALARNVAADAAVPAAQRKRMQSWSAPEVARYIETARADREGALFVLAVLRGMRRGELCGLHWENVDLDGGALQVVETMVLSAGKAVTSEPKTAAGRRRVPLDPFLVDVLRAQRIRQARDRLAAGSGWAGGDWVFADATGRPLKPDHVSAKHATLAAAAGLPPITLHQLRHTCASLMLTAGTPVHTVAAMLGHADPSVTLKTYAHVIHGHADAAGSALTASIVGL